MGRPLCGPPWEEEPPAEVKLTRRPVRLFPERLDLVLDLVPRRAGGSVGGGRQRTTRWPADGSRLSDVGGKGSPTLSMSAARVYHGDDEATGHEATEGSFSAPLPGVPNVGFKVPADPLGSNTGVRAKVSSLRSTPLLAKISRTNSTNSQHKRHEIYTGSGHRSGVIPYSSVVVDCLLG